MNGRSLAKTYRKMVTTGRLHSDTSNDRLEQKTHNFTLWYLEKTLSLRTSEKIWFSVSVMLHLIISFRKIKLKLSLSFNYN